MNALMSTSALKPATLPLNQGQKEAAEAFFQFLFTEGKEMIISGPGGVGKTFLMGHLIDVILPRYYETCSIMGITPEYDSVEMTATTNKAAEALSLATKRPTSTIHSFLSLKPVEDYSTGEQRLTRTRSWTMQMRKIIFVDECSMIDAALLDEILTGTHQCKIVYVGDHCQLAPVKETLSPIYRRGLPFYELTEPMRTGVPELQALNQQLRNTVETGDFNPIKIVPGVIDLLDNTTMPLELTRVFQTQTQESRILAFTNKQVLTFNDFIRDVRQLPEEFTTGEFLVSNTAVQLKNRMISVEEEFEIISQSAQVNFEEIAEGVQLAIRRTDLRTRIGELLTDVPLPADRAHYEALVKYYKGQKNWNRYFHLRNKYPDLRQRDSATVHKAQGSTLDSVFVDLANISTCNIPNQVARMLYVALSRPRHRIFLYGDLAEKYGGLQH